MRRDNLGSVLGALVMTLYGCAGDSGGSSTTSTGTSTATSTGIIDGYFPKAPGKFIADSAIAGTGVCAGKTVEQVIATIVAANPGLPSTLHPAPNLLVLVSDGSYAYPFLKTDGTFAVAFKVGSGDCPAGCIDNEYWYFETSAGCMPTQVGHYRATYSSPGNCYTVVGEAMWGLPEPLDPAVVCGADLSPRNLNGTYQMRAKGRAIACTPAAGKEPMTTVDRLLGITIAQAAGDLSSGTVTITGTGNVAIDGQALPATISRSRFTATRTTSNLPSTCPAESELTITFDFEGSVPNQLSFAERQPLSCPGTDYCKGILDLQLTLEKQVPIGFP